jgi:hypothetical protein
MKKIFKLLKNQQLKTTAILLITIATFGFLGCNKNKESICVNDEPPYNCENGMDVAFLIDYTGSMGGAINDIKAQVANIVSAITTQSGTNYRLSLSIFDEYQKGALPTYNSIAGYTALPATQKMTISTGLTTNQYLTTMQPFALNNSASFTTQLALLNASMPIGNGNGIPEPGDLLLNEVLNNNFAGTWRTGVTKLIIIITDAPASGNDDSSTAVDDTFLTSLANNANLQGVQCVLLTTFAGGNYETKLIANNTSGTFVVSPGFRDVSTNIIDQINNICTKNGLK